MEHHSFLGGKSSISMAVPPKPISTCTSGEQQTAVSIDIQQCDLRCPWSWFCAHIFGGNAIPVITENAETWQVRQVQNGDFYRCTQNAVIGVILKRSDFSSN